MDDQQFDTLVRALAAGITRRGALGILAGLAGLEWADSEAAKGRRKRKGASKKGRQKRRRAQAGAENKKDKVTICHRTGSEKNPFVEIEVAQSAVPAHEAHGDTIDPDFENDPENCGGCGISCDDDDLCTIDTCVEGECVNTPVVCDDDNECTDDACDRETGKCDFRPVSGRPCDDGNACTINDQCRRGTCVGEPRNCDDDNACTEDSCDPDRGCVNTPIVCADDDICTEDRCDPATGCVHPQVVCDDPEETCCRETGCTNLASDQENCGRCGRRCGDGETCCEGVCTAGECAGICDRPINCPAGEFQFCGPEELGCVCGSTTEGGFGCGNVACTGVSCTSSAHCVEQFGPGAFCETVSCCGPDQCVRPCVAGLAAASAESGRTRVSSGD